MPTKLGLYGGPRPRGFGVWVGTGVNVAQDATSTGAGYRQVTGSGAHQAQAATSSGTGTVSGGATGSGAHQAQNATSSGVGTVDATDVTTGGYLAKPRRRPKKEMEPLLRWEPPVEPEVIKKPVEPFKLVEPAIPEVAPAIPEKEIVPIVPVAIPPGIVAPEVKKLPVPIAEILPIEAPAIEPEPVIDDETDVLLLLLMVA